jgi:lipoprotein-anchoring transpeptidase ErfK/SrfK
MIMDSGIAHIGEPDEVARPGLLSRRSLLVGSAVGLVGLGLNGCVSGGMSRAEAAKVYGPVPDERFPIPAVDVSKVNPNYYRRTVRYDTEEAPGTIVVDPGNYYVYRIEDGGNATRYGANVGRAGFLWSGNAYIGRKAEWPIWTPTPDQIGRDPSLKKYAGGMPPGLGNALGSRALYLYQDGVYTLYTIYGTSVPQSIGTGVSSGCIGLLNQDIIHLYARTPVDTKVVVLPA